MRLFYRKKNEWITPYTLKRQDGGIGSVGYHKYYTMTYQYSIPTTDQQRCIYKKSISSSIHNLEISKDFVILKTVKI